jgi:phosphatidate cytidylyltransferase
MFWVRFRSAVILTIIALIALIGGNYLLWGPSLIISVIGIRELYKVFKIENTILGIIGYVATVIWYVMINFNQGDKALMLLIGMMMVVMCVFVFTYPKYETNQITVSIFGMVSLLSTLSILLTPSPKLTHARSDISLYYFFLTLFSFWEKLHSIF